MNQLFRSQRVRFNSFKKLEGLKNRKAFDDSLRTDGFDLEFICNRPKPKFQEGLTPKDVAAKVSLKDAVVWGVDPGIRDVFVAIDGGHKNAHRTRKTSTKEYCHLAGFNKGIITREMVNKTRHEGRRLVAGTYR